MLPGGFFFYEGTTTGDAFLFFVDEGSVPPRPLRLYSTKHGIT